VVSVNLPVTEDRTHRLAFAGAGALYGFISCVDGLANSHDVVAHTQTLAAGSPIATVRQLLASSSGLAQAFNVQLALRSRAIYDRLADSLTLRLSQRLARLLMQLCEHFGLMRGGVTVLSLRVSQTELADCLGASRQSVNEELRHLVEDHVVLLGRSEIKLLDLPALQRRC